MYQSELDEEVEQHNTGEELQQAVEIIGKLQAEIANQEKEIASLTEQLETLLAAVSKANHVAHDIRVKQATEAMEAELDGHPELWDCRDDCSPDCEGEDHKQWEQN